MIHQGDIIRHPGFEDETPPLMLTSFLSNCMLCLRLTETLVISANAVSHVACRRPSVCLATCAVSARHNKGKTMNLCIYYISMSQTSQFCLHHCNQYENRVKQIMQNFNIIRTFPLSVCTNTCRLYTYNTSPWFDLRGWLGVKKEWSIYLFTYKTHMIHIRAKCACIAEYKTNIALLRKGLGSC